MRKIIATLLAALGLSSQASETVIEMRQQFGPEKVFSIMAPTDWVLGSGDTFSINAPNNGASLDIKAYKIPTRPPINEFSKARFEGVTNMGIYIQVDTEHPLTNNTGVVREYEGTWQGDSFVTYYVVACANNQETYACLSLVTTKSDYKTNQAFYEKMLSTFEIHS